MRNIPSTSLIIRLQKGVANRNGKMSLATMNTHDRHVSIDVVLSSVGAGLSTRVMDQCAHRPVWAGQLFSMAPRSLSKITSMKCHQLALALLPHTLVTTAGKCTTAAWSMAAGFFCHIAGIRQVIGERSFNPISLDDRTRDLENLAQQKCYTKFRAG